MSRRQPRLRRSPTSAGSSRPRTPASARRRPSRMSWSAIPIRPAVRTSARPSSPRRSTTRPSTGRRSRVRSRRTATTRSIWTRSTCGSSPSPRAASAERGRMTPYLVLLRGINVGGKNKVSMAELRSVLEGLGFSIVSTYIASGNVLLDSDLSAAEVAAKIEDALPKAFKLDAELIRVLALSADDLEAVVERRPKGFGDEPGKYHSDAIFLMGIDAAEAMTVFSPRDGVDKVWPGDGVIYSQRLSARRTASRLGRIAGTPVYAKLTVRSWQTTLALLDLVRKRLPLERAERKP